MNFKRTTTFFVIFTLSILIGNAQNYPAVFNQNTLNGKNGFVVRGINSGDALGTELSFIGDINHDGLEDIAINTQAIKPNGLELGGTTYIIFGSKKTFPSPFDLTTLNGTNGFKVEGIAEDERRGKSLGKLGDINGDGIDDVALGTEQDKVIILYGKNGSFPAALTLQDINGTNGFVINIEGINEIKGNGDFNGDGINDVVMGQYVWSGETLILFGKNGNFPASISKTWFDGIKGFRLDRLESSYSAMFTDFAGDVNNDGYDDVIVGLWLNSRTPSGKSYVYFGRSGTFTSLVNLKSVTGTDGFAINNYYTNGIKFLTWVGPLGDINNDGYDDFYSQENVLFGAATFSELIDIVASPDATKGFKLSKLYNSAAPAGDLNGDGIDDFIITSNNYENWVVYGSVTGYSTSLDVTLMNQTRGFKIKDISQSNVGRQVSGRGDINGDGLSDFMVGGHDANSYNSGKGVVYVVFGGDHYAIPLTAGYPAARDIRYTSFGLQVKAPEKGIVHYAVYKGSQGSVTSTASILNGTGALQHGDIQIPVVSAVIDKPITGLSLNTKYDVYVYFEDAAGNIGEIYFLNDVTTLADTEGPKISCLQDQKLSCGETVPDYTLTVVVTDNADPKPKVTQSPAAGAVFNPDMTVTLTAEDYVGNKSECSFMVGGKQKIVCPVTQVLQKGDIIPDYTKTAATTGFCNGAPVITQTPAAGTLITEDVVAVTLKAIDDNNISATSTCTISTLATALHSGSALREITIYPNPASDVIHIESEAYSTYEIINNAGNIMMTGKSTTEINVTALSAGMYTILLYDQEYQVVVRKKMIKK